MVAQEWFQSDFDRSAEETPPMTVALNDKSPAFEELLFPTIIGELAALFSLPVHLILL